MEKNKESMTRKQNIDKQREFEKYLKELKVYGLGERFKKLF